MPTCASKRNPIYTLFDNLHLTGLVSRTDILQSYHFYSDDTFASKESFCNKDFSATDSEKDEMEEPCRVCSAHTDCADFSR